MTALEQAKQLLLSGEYTCVLRKGENTYTSVQRGVKPLLQWLESGIDLSGCAAADKVVGKATAFLYVLLGARAVYAGVISRGALEVLRSHGISVEYARKADFIINRKGDGICPFEAAVLDIHNATAAYDAIRHKMNQL